MCMMKNSGEKEACEVARNLEALGVRVTNVETRMDNMKASLNCGTAMGITAWKLILGN